MEYVFPCSPQNVTKAINHENNNEGLEKDEQDSFKLYLKRVKDCLADEGYREKKDQRLESIASNSNLIYCYIACCICNMFLVQQSTSGL